MKLKAVIPAAGKATRMWPMSYILPKALMPIPCYVNSVPFLLPNFYLLLDDVFKSGIEETVVVVNDKSKELFKRALTFDFAATEKCNRQDKEYKEAACWLRHRVCSFRKKTLLVSQTECRGFGHAVLEGAAAVGDVNVNSFLVVLPDHLFSSGHFVSNLVNTYNPAVHLQLIGATTTSVEECSNNGIIIPSHVALLERYQDRPFPLSDIVEKPTHEQTLHLPKPQWASDESLVVCAFGADIVTPSVLSVLAKMSLQQAESGEVELREAQKQVITHSSGLQSYGLFLDQKSQRRDIGTNSLYSQALGMTCWRSLNGVSRRSFSSSSSLVSYAKVPGRIDLMGGIADYSGALVTQVPLTNHYTEVFCYSATRPGYWTITSPGFTSESVPISSLSSYRAGKDRRWLDYVIGTIQALQDTRAVHELLQTGCDVYIKSNIPQCMGLASSASFVSALTLAFSPYHRHSMETAQFCQAVENQGVGVPCGLMDYATVLLGESGRFFTLDCSSPTNGFGTRKISSNLTVVAVDCGPRTVPSLQTNYASIRAQADTEVPVDAHCWADIPPSRVHGKPLNASSLHAVQDCFRCKLFHRVASGESVSTDADNCSVSSGLILGELMFQSHWSYSHLGLSTKTADAMVSGAQSEGKRLGIVGARITGGGNGGTLVLLLMNAKFADQTLGKSITDFFSNHVEGFNPGYIIIEKSSSE